MRNAASFVIRLVISAVAVWVATVVLSGVNINTDSTPRKIGTLLAVALIFGVINAILKPIVKGLACGVYVLTLGLISLLINGLMFWLAGRVAGHLGLPFEVHGFWSSIGGALIVGVTSWLLGIIIPDPKKHRG